MPASRPVEEFGLVKALVAAARSSRDIAAMIGIPYGTVRGWRRRSTPPRSVGHVPLSQPLAVWRPPDPAAYSYLLGIYLGDGCVVEPPRGSTWLTVTLDDRNPKVIRCVETAIGRTVPEISIRRDSGPVALP